jgi:poly(beta-D-mannuronate) lyase
VLIACAWLTFGCGGDGPDLDGVTAGAERAVSASSPLLVGASCDEYQAQQFGDSAFGIEAERRAVLGGSPVTLSLPSAFGGKVVKFGTGTEVALPVSFREPGQYAFYIRGRGSSTGSDSVFASGSYNSAADQYVDFGESGVLEWRQVAVFNVTSEHLHEHGSVRLREREPNFELDAAAFVKMGSGASPEAPFVHTQAIGSDALAFPAERVDSIADPDADGALFSRVDAGFAQGWEVLKAPSVTGGVVGESLAIYRVKFASSGVYQLHLKTRGFTTSSDSFFVPTGFGVDPSVALHTGVHQSFDWQTLSNLNNFVVSSADLGKVLELRIGARDASSELDSLAFVRAGGIATAARLDAELGYFEAENAQTVDIVPVAHAGASGGVRASGFWQVGDRITFGAVPVLSKGRLYVRYSLERDTGKQASVYLDGQDVATVQFMPTGSWAQYATTFAYLPGPGNVELRIDPDDYRANLEEPSASIDRVSLGEDGRTCIVSEPASLPTKLSAAQPGDTFLIPNGRHNQTLALTRSGTPDRPITLRAQTAGEVDLGPGTNGIRLQIVGDYNVVDGVTFANHITGAIAAVVIDGGAPGQSADHNRITNVSIVSFNRSTPGGGSGNQLDWVTAVGNYNRIDHCHFSNKRTQGLIVQMHDADDTPDQHVADYNVADHNYFGPNPFAGDQCAGMDASCLNGWESIRISHSPMFKDSRSAVKYNLFSGADGEGEVISDKADGNYHLYNTFENLAHGHLTLRHARKALVEGNTFINCSIGVRAYGSDHVIVNNRFQAVVTGVSIRGGQAGLNADEGNQRYCYFAPDRLIVAHNTFTQSGTAIVSQEGNDCENYFPQAPRGIDEADNVIIANNFSAAGVIPFQQSLPLMAPLFVSNLTTIAPPPQFWAQTQAPVAPDPMGILRASSGSGIDQAGASASVIRATAGMGFAYYPDILADVDGQTRSTSVPDVGADDLGGVPGYVHRLFRADVGPRWGTRLPDQ